MQIEGVQRRKGRKEGGRFGGDSEDDKCENDHRRVPDDKTQEFGTTIWQEIKEEIG